MLRLRRDDFEDGRELATIARVAGLSADAFRREFGYLIEAEPPRLRLDLERGFVPDDEVPPVPADGRDDQLPL